jgi:hypothetical protein
MTYQELQVSMKNNSLTNAIAMKITIEQLEMNCKNNYLIIEIEGLKYWKDLKKTYIYIYIYTYVYIYINQGLKNI